MIKFAEGKKMAEVSIVIPNYNGMKYIEDCLQAVYAQRVEQEPDTEILVVDNGSVSYTHLRAHET